MAREGGSRLYIYIYVERGWEGEGVFVFLQIHYEGGGVGWGLEGRGGGRGLVFFVNFFLKLLNGYGRGPGCCFGAVDGQRKGEGVDF